HVDYRHPYYDAAVVEAALGVPAALRAERRAHAPAPAPLSPALAQGRRQGEPHGVTLPRWPPRAPPPPGPVRGAVRWRANRAGLNPLLARPDRRGFADYNDELRRGSRRLLHDVLLAPRTLERGWWRAATLREMTGAHLAGRANHATALGVILTVE